MSTPHGLSRVLPLIALVLLLAAVPALAEEKATPTVAEQMAGLQAMCDESADARTARHAAEPLWNRLGGREKLLALMDDIVARHRVNEPIAHLMEGVDDAQLAAHLVDFVSVGTGGGGKYTGRSLQEAHKPMEMGDAHFLAAGSDVIAAMQAMDYSQNEIDEFVCILVSLKSAVVFK